jgi:hygromycin-B 4-O-kinase
MESEQRPLVADTGSNVPAAVGVDEAAVFLAAHHGGSVESVTAVGHGEWSRAFTYRHDGLDRVIRFSALDEDFAKDRLAARYRSPALPVPRLLEMGEAFGGFYAVSERAHGRYLDDLSHNEMRALLPSLFAALDTARCVEVPAGAGYGIWGADGHATHASWRAALLDVVNDPPDGRIHPWHAPLAAAPERIAAFDEGVAHLRRLVPACPEDRHLIHSDLLNFNVLVDGDRVAAVLDWGCAMYGDFLYDIAWLVFWAPWYAAWRGIDFAEEAARHYAAIRLAVPNFEQRLRCYQVHIGLSDQAYNAYKGRWPLVDAVARRTLEVAG